jgi:signal transduction histidine kinase
MTGLVRDSVLKILPFSRDRKFDEARAALADLESHRGAEAKAVTQDCRALLEWRVSTVNQRPLAEGLTEAALAVSRLSEAGYEAHLGWAYLTVGYAIGLQGDFERGLEWLDVAIADARLRNDRRQLILSLSHRASLFVHAEELERGHALYEEVLALCVDGDAALRPGFLANLAHCRVRQAQMLSPDDPSRAQYASEAIATATEALDTVGPDHPQAFWRGVFGHNRADALVLLGRTAEAEAFYRQALVDAEQNLKVKVQLIASYAGLLLEQGRREEARRLLDEAEAIPPWDLISPATGKVHELGIALASEEGRHADAAVLWERRFRRAQEQHASRLRIVRRHAELFEQLRREQAHAAKMQEEAEGQRSAREEQERFLAMLTHELKTPLSAARISLGAMKATGRHAERIERALDNINEIVDRCRVTGELEGRRLQPAVKPCNLREIVAQAVEGSSQRRRVRLFRRNPPSVLTDPFLAGIVFANLIDNALKYSPSGSDVTIDWKRSGSGANRGIEVVVANRPVVGSLPNPDRVFEKYFRGRRARGKSGSGLGLYLSKGIAELLGGRIECRATAEQVEFALWLPR